ncbi:MAG: ATP-binding protein [Hyphomonas sp.]|nr:ATP-binding protein [Hyphomonas sp.]
MDGSRPTLSEALYPRHAERRVRDALADTRVVAITGPRQSGKTTLARSFADPDRAYLTLDDPATLSAARSDPAGLVSRIGPAVIDEIQRAPDLALAIKQAVDTDPRPGRFLITGSADILAMPKAAESLAGRVEIIELLPISRSEMERRPPSAFIGRLMDGNLRDAEGSAIDLVDLVLAGGYPEALARKDQRRRRDWQRAYLRSILDRDLRDIASADRLDRMPALFDLLAARAGQLVNWSNLGKDARLDGKTVERYVRLLENLYLVRRLPAWSSNETQRLVSTPKLHVLDSGLLAATTNLTADRLTIDRAPMGPALECFVVAELFKSPMLHEREVRLSHYRDKDQVEVDIVLEDTEGRLAGIEVKASSTVTAADFRGLKRLRERKPDRFKLGVVLYDGHRILPFGERLLAAPIACLWRSA